jgi:ribosomal protein S13
MAVLGLNTRFFKINNFTALLNKNQLILQQWLNILKGQQREHAANLNSYWSFLIENKFYKGLRYSKNLPVHGQRTHTNRKTARKLNGKK